MSWRLRVPSVDEEEEEAEEEDAAPGTHTIGKSWGGCAHESVAGVCEQETRRWAQKFQSSGSATGATLAIRRPRRCEVPVGVVTTVLVVEIPKASTHWNGCMQASPHSPVHRCGPCTDVVNHRTSICLSVSAPVEPNVGPTAWDHRVSCTQCRTIVVCLFIDASHADLMRSSADASGLPPSATPSTLPAP